MKEGRKRTAATDSSGKVFLMKTIGRGDTGALTETVQLALYRAGFLSGPPDGFFGPRTEDALLRFQNAFGLPPTGMADEATREKLFRFVKGYFIKTVQPGDTFWGLAVRYGAPVSSLLAANPDLDPLTLQPGQKLTVPLGYQVTPDNVSYCAELVGLVIEGLRARYPFTEVSSIGRSVLGTEIPLLCAGEGKNALLISAGIHANEWLNIPVTLTFLEDWLQAVITGREIAGEDAAALYRNTKVYFLPMLNPDGLDLVTGALKSGAAFDRAVRIAQNYPAVPFPEGWKANVEGVDLNLQFPAGWEKARDIKFAQGFDSPAPRDYVGDAPLTAPEARALYEFTNAYPPKMILAYHSQGNIIYWKYQDYLPPQSFSVGETLSEASGYPLEPTPEDSSYAGYKDWFIAQYNRPGYTVETGSGTNPLPVKQFDEIYRANAPLIAAAMRECAEL